jgi:hypothetical protein
MDDLMTIAPETLINLHARLWREFDAHNDPRVFWRLVAIEVHANLTGMDMAVFARHKEHHDADRG